MGYIDQIKKLAKDARRPITAFIALAPQNDPFYCGTPGDKLWGEWFAELWNRFGYTTGVHLRRIHYRIVSQSPPVLMPNGKPYENTLECWKDLTDASKYARYLKLVDVNDFDDKRSTAARDFEKAVINAPNIGVDYFSYGDSDGLSIELPEFPDPPGYLIGGYDQHQPYHLEIWCEKSTMNDILEGLAERFGATVQIGVGEMSITRVRDLVKRIQKKDRPARIFYISDFDPAGKSMPVAVARKLEYFSYERSVELDIRVFPLVLTEDQCRDYQLPRTPIKEAEKRAAHFEERFGAGATELDALEALHPGALSQIIAEAMAPYYDKGLVRRVGDAWRVLKHDLDALEEIVHTEHEDEIEQLRGEYDAIRESLEAQLQDIDERRKAIWQAISDELRQRTPKIKDYPVPEPLYADDEPDALYDSNRDYETQIGAYKEFQGKDSAA